MSSWGAEVVLHGEAKPNCVEHIRQHILAEDRNVYKDKGGLLYHFLCDFSVVVVIPNMGDGQACVQLKLLDAIAAAFENNTCSAS